MKSDFLCLTKQTFHAGKETPLCSRRPRFENAVCRLLSMRNAADPSCGCDASEWAIGEAF